MNAAATEIIRVRLPRLSLAATTISAFLLLLIPHFAIAAKVLAPDRDPGGFARLAPSHTAVFSFPASGNLSITLDVPRLRRVELLIEVSDPTIRFSVVSTGEKQLISLRPEESGWFVVSFPVTEFDTFRLNAQPAAHSDEQSVFQFRVESIPVSSESDIKWERAEALYSSAETLRASMRGADILEAIPKYRQAASDWADLRHPEPQIIALAGEARAWQELSQYRLGIRTVNRALGMTSSVPHLRASLLSLKSQLFLDQWKSVEAWKCAQKALTLSLELHDTQLIADALADRGESRYLTHEPLESDDVDDALKMARESGAMMTAARALRCKSWIEQDRGHLTRAISLMQEAQKSFRGAGALRDAWEAMSDIATDQGIAGNWYSAVLAHSRMAPLTREAGNIANYGFILENIGWEYTQLNRDHDAQVYFQKAERAFSSVHHLSGEAISQGQLCATELRLKQLGSAIVDCRRSANFAEQVHDDKRRGTTHWRQGLVQLASGKVNQAIKSFRQALNFSKRAKDNRFQSQALISWGDALEVLHKREEALALFKDALPLGQAAEDATLKLEARYRIGNSYANAGRRAEAISELKTALDEIETQRRSVGNGDLRASYIAAMRKCYASYVDILMSEHDLDPHSDALALQVTESARARTLLDALTTRAHDQFTHRRGHATADLVRLRFEVEQAYEQRLKLMLEGGHKRELHDNSATLMQAIDSLERMEDGDMEYDREQSQPGQPMSAQDILQASNSSDTAFLEFALGPSRSYLWLVSRGTIKSLILPSRNRIENEVRHWRELVTSRVRAVNESFDEYRKRINAADRDIPRVSSNLSCMLLGSLIQPEMGRLVIVADGELESLSFASLPVNGCDGMPHLPLAAAHPVTNAPSLSVFLLPRTRTEQNTFHGEVAIVADPVFERDDVRLAVSGEAHNLPRIKYPEGGGRATPRLPRLIGTRDEALAISDLLGPDRSFLALDFSANLRTVLSPAMADYRIWHLATHGVVDESSPGFSGLIFSLVGSDGHSEFGYLKARDIADLELHSELVVLSSCSSAAGENLSGEGTTGLPYAFLHAGVRRVISTLWNVDDETSKELNVAFYQELLSNGNDPAEALRQSQLRMMHRLHRSSPYYWAAFVLTSSGT